MCPGTALQAIAAGVLGRSRSGMFQRFTWSGGETYTLRASSGAGNLTSKPRRELVQKGGLRSCRSVNNRASVLEATQHFPTTQE